MSSRKKSSRNQRTVLDMEETKLNKKQANDVSKTWHLQQRHLDSNIKQISTLHKSALGSIDVETNRMRAQAEKLMKQQLRLADEDSPKEQHLRAELGLERRKSSINPQEVLNAAQALGLPSLENERRSSFSGGDMLSPVVDGGRRRSSFNAHDNKRGSFAREQCLSAVPRRNARFSTHPDHADTTESDDDYIEIPAITISAAPDDNNKPSPVLHKKSSSRSPTNNVSSHAISSPSSKLESPNAPSRRGSKQNMDSPKLDSGRKSTTKNGRRQSTRCNVSLDSPPSDATQKRRTSISTRRKSTQLRARTEKELRNPQVRGPVGSDEESEGTGSNEEDGASDLKHQLELLENCRYLRRKSDADRELTIDEIFAKD